MKDYITVFNNMMDWFEEEINERIRASEEFSKAVKDMIKADSELFKSFDSDLISLYDDLSNAQTDINTLKINFYSFCAIHKYAFGSDEQSWQDITERQSESYKQMIAEAEEKYASIEKKFLSRITGGEKEKYNMRRETEKKYEQMRYDFFAEYISEMLRKCGEYFLSKE